MTTGIGKEIASVICCKNQGTNDVVENCMAIQSLSSNDNDS